MIMGTIQETFMSIDPKMVQLRTQMFLQAGMLPQQGQATVQGQMSSGISQPQRYPADEITGATLGMLQVPWCRMGRKKTVGQGEV